MSLYNMVCGINPAAGRLLALIALHPETIPRLRDVWINDDFTEVTVHTRTGGGNREEYQQQNADMQTHPLYVRDSDDAFDSTFADFVYRVRPEEREELLKEIQDQIGDNQEKRTHLMQVITETPRSKFDKAMQVLGESNDNTQP